MHKCDKISFQVKENDNSLTPYIISFDKQLKSLKDFYILDDFYGQIKSIEIIEKINIESTENKIENNKTISKIKNKLKINKDNSKKDEQEGQLISQIFDPYLLSDNGHLYSRDFNKPNISDNFINSNESESKASINVVNLNFFQANYKN